MHLISGSGGLCPARPPRECNQALYPLGASCPVGRARHCGSGGRPHGCTEIGYVRAKRFSSRQRRSKCLVAVELYKEKERLRSGAVLHQLASPLCTVSGFPLHHLPHSPPLPPLTLSSFSVAETRLPPTSLGPLWPPQPSTFTPCNHTSPSLEVTYLPTLFPHLSSFCTLHPTHTSQAA